MWILSAAVLLLPVVNAAQAPVFKAPCPSPYEQCNNWGDFSNGSLPKPNLVPGKVFDHFVTLWFENTAFETAASTKVFQELSKLGITLTNSHAETHPSEPNYVSAVSGDYFGMCDDAPYNIPPYIATVVDLLEERRIGWASYQESQKSDGSENFIETSPNYLNKSAPPYPYWERKHNGYIIHNSIAAVPERRKLNRNFNSFVADLKAGHLPSFIHITPNMVNDIHDTDTIFGGNWLEFFLVPLLKDKRFNREKTLIQLHWDEDDSAPGHTNRIYTVLLGSAIPKHLQGTVDNTYYTHYSALSTVEVNWGLGCLGRGDTNKTMANVYDFVAKTTGYKNVKVTNPPETNHSCNVPGPLNPHLFVPNYPLPNIKAKCPGGGRVFIPKGLNLHQPPNPPPVDLTKLNKTVPDGGLRATTTAHPTPTSHHPPGHTPPGHDHGHDNGHNNGHDSGHGDNGHNNGHDSGHGDNGHDDHGHHYRYRS